MLRRLTLGFFSLACAVAVAACSSSVSTPSSGGVPGVGENFPPNSIYATSSSNNVVYIYAPSPAPSAAPVNQIGGTNTSLNGPQYSAFNSGKQLFVTNYNASTSQAAIEEYQEYAMGDVLSLASFSGGLTGLTQPRGIAIDAKSQNLVVANVNPAASAPNQVLLFATSTFGSVAPTVIAGNLTQLNSPTGVGFDAADRIYVANRGGGSVTVYAMPSPTPVPTTSATASPSPTPSPSSSGSPSPTPSPTPIPGDNVAPIQTITGLGAPTGLSLDANGNIYVADPDSGNPSIYVFAPGATSAAAATRHINGSSTQLVFPTDVKVDAAGNIYVADSAANKILIFAPNATGNVAPATSIPFAAGTLIGLTLSP
ncbi:MAG: hypothetical protein ACXWNZ_01295 [Vulcanimicrobiaceae bacterium]